MIVTRRYAMERRISCYAWWTTPETRCSRNIFASRLFTRDAWIGREKQAVKRGCSSWLLAGFLCLLITPAMSSAIGIGDAVKVIANLNVRNGPDTDYGEITDPDYPGTAKAGTTGKVTAGPQNASGYTWWRVDFGPGLYMGWLVQDGLQVTTSSQAAVANIALTLYVYEGNVGGPLILGAKVSGEDGAGSNFDQTTNASGYVTIFGRPGTWKFTAAKDSYQPNAWSQDIASTCTRYAYLQKSSTPRLPNPPTPDGSAGSGSEPHSEGGLKVLNAPFITQCPPGTWDKTRNCGQASMLMVLSYFSGSIPTPDKIKEIDDWLNSEYGDSVRDYNGSFTDRHKLVTLAQEYAGLGQSYTVNGWAMSDITASIDQGRPVIAAIAGKDIPIEYQKGTAWVSNDVNYPKGHWVVVTGYSDEYIICNDSGRQFGKSARYKRQTFLSAMYDNWSSNDWRGAVVVVKPSPPPESSSNLSNTEASILGRWVYAKDSRLAEITTLQFEQGGAVLVGGPLGNIQIRTTDCSSGEWKVEQNSSISFHFTEQSDLQFSARIEGDKLAGFRAGGLASAITLIKGANAQQVYVTPQTAVWNNYVSEGSLATSTLTLTIRRDGTFLAVGSVRNRWRVLDDGSVQVYLRDEKGNTLEHSRFTIKDDKLVDGVCGASYRR